MSCQNCNDHLEVFLWIPGEGGLAVMVIDQAGERSGKGVEMGGQQAGQVGVALQPIKGLSGLFETMGLERLILGKGEYPDGIIRYIRSKGIEVVEEEYER